MKYSVQLVGKLRLYNNDILVSLWVGPDGKNSDQYIVQAGHRQSLLYLTHQLAVRPVGSSPAEL